MRDSQDFRLKIQAASKFELLLSVGCKYMGFSIDN